MERMSDYTIVVWQFEIHFRTVGNFKMHQISMVHNEMHCSSVVNLSIFPKQAVPQMLSIGLDFEDT